MTTGISVIIPAYNYAHYLPFAIDSVLAQDYPLFEVIVIDDGSTDNTAEVVKRYGDAVRYVYQENSGLAAARNTGLSQARYDYISLLDADDIFLPDLLTELKKVLDDLPEEYVMVAPMLYIMNENGELLHVRHARAATQAREVTLKDLLIHNHMTSSGALIKRRAFETCGNFDTTLPSSEDRDMWIRFATNFRLYLHNQALSAIRRHSCNMSKNPGGMKKSARTVLKKAYKQRVLPALHPHWLKSLAFNHYEAACVYSDCSILNRALPELLKSFLCWPVFLQHQKIGVPFAFRLRAIRLFLIRYFTARTLRLKTGKKRKV